MGGFFFGSSSYISNLDGEVVQHVEYVPFGEVFLEEKNAVWNTPFLFNGKELDKETGMSYYGARYYEAKTSVWISVDPLAEETPNWSPYAFCNNNPLFFTDPTGMSAEPPVNGLDYFSDNTGEYFWNKDKNAYAVHTPNGDGTTSFSGNYYTANEFSKPVGDYSIIFDLSNAKPKDEFNKNHTITSVSDPLYSYLNTRSIIDGGGLKNISDPEKFPGVEIYSSPHMNGALTAGNVIFTNPGMEDNSTLAHEYGHYLDYKNHFKYNQSEYLKTIALPSFISATRATFDKTRNHEDSKSEQRANILGGAFSGLKLYKR